MAGEKRPVTGAEGRIGNARLIAYGQMVVPLAVIGLPVAIYIPPFYGDTLGLDLAAVGLILMLARLSDVVTDPLIGQLSDRARTPWGRRRPWVIAGVPLMMVSAYMLFLPAETVSGLYLFVWIAAIYFGFTLIVIPYGAWGAELSTDYRDRSRVTGVREMFLLAGLLLAITAPVIGAAAAPDGTAVSREAMRILGWLTAGLLPVCAIVLMVFVREPPPKEFRHVPLKDGLRAVARNGPFVRILAATMVGALAGSINGAVAILFYDHVLELGERGLLIILVLVIAAVAGAPVWVRLGNRIGKHRALATAALVSMAALAMVPLIVYALKPHWPGAVFAALMAVTIVRGFTGAATPILGASILADVADLDALRTGEQRTGFLFSFLGMTRKIFEAVGVGIALPIVSWMGFESQAERQSDAAQFGLLLMYCLVPLVLWLASIAIIWNYPLTAARQARIRAAYERRLDRRSQAASETAT